MKCIQATALREKHINVTACELPDASQYDGTPIPMKFNVACMLLQCLVQHNLLEKKEACGLFVAIGVT